MTNSPIALLAAGLAAFCCLSVGLPQAAAAGPPLEKIWLGSGSESRPSDVELIPRGGMPTQLSWAAADNGFVGSVNVPQPPSWGKEYTLVALCGNGGAGHQQFYLYVTPQVATLGPEIRVRSFCTTPDVALSELRHVENIGKDQISLLQMYVVARYVYRNAPGDSPFLREEALKDWYDAGYRLATRYAYFAPDPEVMEIAAQDKGKFSGYFKSMNQQLAALQYSDASLVKRYIDKGDLREAKTLNTFLINRLTAASPTIRAAAVQSQGVSLRLLGGNAAYLNTLIRQKSP